MSPDGDQDGSGTGKDFLGEGWAGELRGAGDGEVMASGSVCFPLQTGL